MKIAIVTFEFEGLTKNGGIGTAFRKLAELLAGRGHQVTVVFVPFQPFPHSSPAMQRELEILSRKKIRVSVLEQNTLILQTSFLSHHLTRALSVYRFLRRSSFDVIHGPDNCGLLYYCLTARRLDFPQTRFIIGAHGSPLWTCEANRIYRRESIFLSELDRISIELADHLISPSSYMVDYLREKGWKLSQKTQVIPNVNSLEKLSIRAPRSRHATGRQTLIYFGRLEPRKGIFLFLRAIQALLSEDARAGKKRNLHVHFVGRDSISRQNFSFPEYIRQQLSFFDDRVKVSFESNLSSAESLAFLRKNRNALICLPSLLDNSPYVLIELLELGLNFISSRSGGQAELIDSRDHERVFFAPRRSALVETLKRRLAAAPIKVRPSGKALGANQEWLNLHTGLKREGALAIPRKPTRPLISVVLGAQSADPEEALSSLRSILGQTYPKIELCVAEALQIPRGMRKKIKVVHFKKPSRFPAWQSAAKAATGDFLLFLDGGALTSRGALAALVRGAELIADPAIACISTLEDLPGTDPKSRHRQRIAFPSASALTLLSKTNASRFALWRRADFEKCLHASLSENFLDSTATEILSALRASGKGSQELPIGGIRAFPFRAVSDEDEQNERFAAIRAKKGPNTKIYDPFLYFSASLMAERENLVAERDALLAERDALRPKLETKARLDGTTTETKIRDVKSVQQRLETQRSSAGTSTET